MGRQFVLFLSMPSKRLATALLAVASRIPIAPLIPSNKEPPMRNKQDASIFMATSVSVSGS